MERIKIVTQSGSGLKLQVGGNFLLSIPGDPEVEARKILADLHLQDLKISIKEVIINNIARFKVFYTGLAEYSLYVAWNLADKLSKIPGVCAPCASPSALPELIPAPEPMTKTKIRSLTPRSA